MSLYFGTDKIEKVAIKFEGMSGTDTSDATLSNGNQMLEGVTAYSQDQKYTGTIPSKEAATITPGATDQTIESGQYLAGVQTIQGDSNLIANNIASGVSIFGVVGTHSGIDTSSATATSADILNGKTAYVNGKKITGGYAIASATALKTVSSDSTSISFTVSGQPIAWSVIQITNTSDSVSNTRFICACNSNGHSTSMATSSSYGRQYTYVSNITSTYADGTLTISTSSSSNTGTFRGGTSYQLLYVYENITVVEPLPEGQVGTISEDNVISLDDTQLESGTYTLYYEDENESKLEGWGAICTINK